MNFDDLKMLVGQSFRNPEGAARALLSGSAE